MHAFLGHVQVAVDGVVRLFVDGGSILFRYERFQLGEQCFCVVSRLDLIVGESEAVLCEASDDLFWLLCLLLEFHLHHLGPLFLYAPHDPTDLFGDTSEDSTLSAHHGRIDLLVHHLE